MLLCSIPVSPRKRDVPLCRPLHEPTTAAMSPTASLLGTRLTCFRDSLLPRVAGRVREADMQLSPTACRAARVVVQKYTTASAAHATFDVVSCQRGDMKTKGLVASLLKSRSTLRTLLAGVPRSPLDMRGHGHRETGSDSLYAPAGWSAHWK